jgi:hypothetical protein
MTAISRHRPSRPQRENQSTVFGSATRSDDSSDDTSPGGYQHSCGDSSDERSVSRACLIASEDLVGGLFCGVLPQLPPAAVVRITNTPESARPGACGSLEKITFDQDSEDMAVPAGRIR